MQKIFFTICFIYAMVTANAGFASIEPLQGSFDELPKQSARIDVNAKVDNLPDPNNQEAVHEFFKKRFEEAVSMPKTKDIDWNNAMGINIVHTPEYYAQKNEQNKPLFQKMYEKAVAALHQEQPITENDAEGIANETEQLEANEATRFFTIQQPEASPIAQQDNIPTVSLSLPSGKKVLAPAREHIPYFLSYIDIQANGYIKVEDTIIIVANDKKFAHGLRRVFSKHTDNGHHIDLLLDDVVVNGTQVPYVAEEIGNNIVIKPKYNQRLAPGVYTYKFSYLINNKLIKVHDDYFLNWNINGRPLNTFITSANAIVSIPQGHTFDKIATLIGRNNHYTNLRTNVYSLAGNVIAFSNNTPLFNGENMNIVAFMNKNVFIKDFDTGFNQFLTNWGNVLYAVIGLAAILISFLLSLIGLQNDRKKGKYNPSYGGALMRSILVGKYDRVAFIAQILELYRKQALDITSGNNCISLSKLNIKNDKLTKAEKKGLKALFSRKNKQIDIINTNNIVIKKVKNIFEKNVNKQIRKYRLIHNIGYVLFSCAMLILTEIFMAIDSINIAQSLIILLSTTVLYAFYIWIIRHKFKHWFVALPIKIFILLAIFIVWLFSSIYIGKIPSLIVLISVFVIFMFSRLFNEQNNFINEAKNTISSYKEYLIGNADVINLSRDFLNQQSNIFALGINEHFPQNASNKSFYKLDAAENMKQALIDII